MMGESQAGSEDTNRLNLVFTATPSRPVKYALRSREKSAVRNGVMMKTKSKKRPKGSAQSEEKNATARTVGATTFIFDNPMDRRKRY